MIKSRRILVVDDEVITTDLCRISLSKLGHDVVCVVSGEHAIALAAGEEFDVTIINPLLSGMSGIEAFELLRQNHPFLSGILITDYVSLDMVTAAMNKGFCHILKKPLDVQELIDVVKEITKSISLQEDNTRLNTLLPLYQLGENFLAAEHEEDVYHELIDAVMKAVNVTAASLMMWDEQGGVLRVVASQGLDEKIVRGVEIKPGEKIAGRVFELNKPVILNRHSQHLGPFTKFLKRRELAAAISFPISSKNKVLGVLNVSQTRDNTEFSDADIEMLSVISRQAVMAIENVRSILEREETSRATALLEQYVSPEISGILMENKKDLMDMGKVQDLTVLFADIRNFTLLVQRVPPEKLRIFLNNFFDLFADIVFSCQGTLDKFMGDAVLVIFGAPVEIDAPSISAVSAAGQIMEEFEKLRNIWALKDPVFSQIGLGIGISRGPMFLGNVGSSRRLDYTVIGTDVNIAQRLASDTLSGQVLLTEPVIADLEGKFQIQPENKRLLRGMESEIELFSLVY